MFEGKSGQVVLDQLRTVDKTRLLARAGRLEESTTENVLQVLQEMSAT